MTRSRGIHAYARASRDDVGKVYGRLTVEAYGPADASGAITLTCRCTCGGLVTATRSNVRLGKTTSCGCYQRAQTSQANLVHGRAHSPLYQVWAGMRTRCGDPNAPGYAKYGALGVRVCQRWQDSFELFLSDMGERPSPQHSLDRWPNPHGHYEPGNVRWATIGEQRRNRRINKLITYQGREQLLTDWTRELGLPFSAIRYRLRIGWTPEAAFTTPLKPNKRRH